MTLEHYPTDAELLEDFRMAITEGTSFANPLKELWRETEGDYYADSISVDEGLKHIAINCGGFVCQASLREWLRAMMFAREVEENNWPSFQELKLRISRSILAEEGAVEAHGEQDAQQRYAEEHDRYYAHPEDEKAP